MGSKNISSNIEIKQLINESVFNISMDEDILKNIKCKYNCLKDIKAKYNLENIEALKLCVIKGYGVAFLPYYTIKKEVERGAKNFRNIERLIQRVKRYKINEKDYTDILMIFDIMELLYPNFWEQSKRKNIDKITINKDETDVFYSVIKDFKERIYLEKNGSDISNSYLDFFIYSMFEAVRRYKISEINNNFSYYENIKI